MVSDMSLRYGNHSLLPLMTFNVHALPYTHIPRSFAELPRTSMSLTPHSEPTNIRETCMCV